MVRKKSLPKAKSNPKKDSAPPESPSRSISSSDPLLQTPTRRSPRGSQSQTQKKVVTQTQKKVMSSEKKKKKWHAKRILIGNKEFSISTKTLREIKFYQNSTHNLIPKLPFSRLVQEIMSAYVPQGRRIQRAALEALQEASETYIVQYFEDSYICSLHARRSTLIPRDMKLVENLRKRM